MTFVATEELQSTRVWAQVTGCSDIRSIMTEKTAYVYQHWSVVCLCVHQSCWASPSCFWDKMLRSWSVWLLALLFSATRSVHLEVDESTASTRTTEAEPCAVDHQPWACSISLDQRRSRSGMFRNISVMHRNMYRNMYVMRMGCYLRLLEIWLQPSVKNEPVSETKSVTLLGLRECWAHMGNAFELNWRMFWCINLRGTAALYPGTKS